MTIEEVQQQIYTVGFVAFLKQVHDALTEIGEHDPLSEHLAEQMQELILWQEDFSQSDEAEGLPGDCLDQTGGFFDSLASERGAIATGREAAPASIWAE